MYKILMILMFTLGLQAELINGVAMVIEGEAVTLDDLKKEMITSKVDIEAAKATWIRRKLEDSEIRDRKIKVSSAEVYDDIKQMASRNSMNVSELYEAVRNSSGLTSKEFKTKTKQKLLSQKLYSAIAYASVSQPSEEEAQEYFDIHKNDFSHPSGYKVIAYNTKQQARLEQKIHNPMLYAPDINQEEQTLKYDKISPELATFLSRSKLNTFTPAIPNGKGGYMAFYIKEIDSASDIGFRGVRSQVVNLIMADKREQVLSDYFARLQGNADIKIIRMPK